MQVKDEQKSSADKNHEELSRMTLHNLGASPQQQQATSQQTRPQANDEQAMFANMMMQQ